MFSGLSFAFFVASMGRLFETERNIFSDIGLRESKSAERRDSVRDVKRKTEMGEI